MFLIGFLISEDGGWCVVDIIGVGIIFGGMEMMDKFVIYVVEDFVNVGYLRDVEVLLIVELDGFEDEVNYLIGCVEEIVN